MCLQGEEGCGCFADFTCAADDGQVLVLGGLLAEVTGQQKTVVNSLHSQAVDRLADGLDLEATAEDGLIEAFVVRDAPGFTLGVQWHPEWKVADNDVSLSIFQAFGDACQAYQSG